MRLREKYQKEAVPALKEKFKNVMAVPKIEKVVVNTGIGKLTSVKTNEEKKKIYDTVLEDLSLIVGQKAVLTKAKKSISAFKLREGSAVGAKAVLRGERMYDFLDRLINIAMPRLRDFRGIDLKSFDKKGNLTIAFKEQTVFPEVPPEKSRVLFGFEITIVTSAENKEEGIELLRLMGFPLKKNG